MKYPGLFLAFPVLALHQGRLWDVWKGGGMGTRMDSSAALWVEKHSAIEGGLGIPANLKCHMYTMIRAQKHCMGSLKRAALVPFYSQHYNRTLLETAF